DHILGLIDTGIRSIRNVTNDLRPSLLDDLGLLPALRSLVADFAERSGIAATLAEPDELPPLSPDAELALFRSLQEALSNVLRHAAATSVEVAITYSGPSVLLRVADNGRGLPEATGEGRFERNGHMGLAGMRERITALGGLVRIGSGDQSGAVIEVLLPAPSRQ
ncbi:MAG TPA: ATP-binding protein, partial [Gemmatimonadales bacterium]